MMFEAFMRVLIVICMIVCVVKKHGVFQTAAEITEDPLSDLVDSELSELQPDNAIIDQSVGEIDEESYKQLLR